MNNVAAGSVAVPSPAPAAAPPALPILLSERNFVVPASAHTLAGFRAWACSDSFPEQGRVSFLDREIFVDMSPEEIETHNKIKGEVGYALIGLNKRIKLGEYYTDGVLLTNSEANLSTESDASFVTYESLEAQRVRLIPRKAAEGQYIEIEGTPDWVMEVVSNSSVAKDTRVLRELYHRAGIPEYWLIDARGGDIDFQILVRGESEYTSTPGKGGWQKSPLFKRRFRLVREPGRLGLWEYTLQSRPLR
jgi:Uma2 family endonuclease